MSRPHLKRDRVITIPCTRSRGPRGFFCLQVDRRGPVIVDVITLKKMQKRRFRHFSIGFLLMLTAVVCIGVVVAISPHEHACRIAELIDDAKPAWEQEYLNDETRQALNDKIAGVQSDIPECTFAFETKILPRTFSDILLLRQPIEITYTANPIPPEWEGAITRHRVSFCVGVNEMRQTAESKNVLHYYVD